MNAFSTVSQGTWPVWSYEIETIAKFVYTKAVRGLNLLRINDLASSQTYQRGRQLWLSLQL